MSVHRKVHRDGSVELEDDTTGKHVLLMDGFEVSSGDRTLGIVTVACVIVCADCRSRWMVPLDLYAPGWTGCRTCRRAVYLPILTMSPVAGDPASWPNQVVRSPRVRG